MTIEEQLIILNNKFAELHEKFNLCEKKLQEIDNRYANKRNSLVSSIKNEISQLEEKKEEILKYYRIAKDNSYKDINLGARPIKPDIAKLNDTIVKINEFNRNDYTAGTVIDLASSYISYLNLEIEKIDSKGENLLFELDIQKKQEQVRINNEKKQILHNCKQYLKSETMKNLINLFDAIRRDYEITSDFFKNYKYPQKRKRMMLFGYQKYKIDAPKILLADLKSCLKNHFDENKCTINCPCGYITDKHKIINVEYTEKNETELFSGIQAVVLNILRNFGPVNYKITLLDYIHYNSEVLGPLYGLSAGKNRFVDEVPFDNKSLECKIDSLAFYYRKIEPIIGVSNVYEYNGKTSNKRKIPLRMIIINKQEKSFQTDKPGMTYLLNNAKKFGLTIINMTRSADGGGKGKNKGKKYVTNVENNVHIISDSNGQFYINKNDNWLEYTWMNSPSSLPSRFVDGIVKLTEPVEVGTKYFKRYKMGMPVKSSGLIRKPISVPFAIDENDNVINCTFENENFAAYIMGAAGSGKSTLLHTIISGLIMNYHPDEVELWLLDFKMLEFKRYSKLCPPHVKYLLLEKSEDLVFDILDQLTDLLDERQFLFSQHGWSKLTDVPVSENIPAIFVIIDEFAQMSQILKETKGAGYGSDYTIKLENLLAKGRALGIKFIFASQTYTTGISGLTETACKQIQMRFALKNTPDEIKQTLTLSSNETTNEISQWISSLPAYETLFKWRDNENNIHIGKYRNMYAESDEINTLISMINNGMQPLPMGSRTDNKTYINKKPILIDGGQPKTFKSQTLYYKDYENTIDKDDIDENDVLIYAGVPCSFNLARPFLLCNGIAENILIIGGNRENKISILLSIMNSYSRTGNLIEIWAHERSTSYKKYRNSVLSKRKQITDLDDICTQISEIKAKVQSREFNGKLIAIFGYELISNDLEILGEDADMMHKPKARKKSDKSLPDMNEILERVKQCSDPEEKKRIIAEYNQQKDIVERENSEDEYEETSVGIYDARSDMEWLLKRASNYGVHFVFCFEQAKDFLSLRMDEKSFQHKILFSMAKDESMSIMNNRKANELEGGTCVYSDGKEMFTLRPHLYHGVPCNGWMVDNDGKIVQRR